MHAWQLDLGADQIDGARLACNLATVLINALIRWGQSTEEGNKLLLFHTRRRRQCGRQRRRGGRRQPGPLGVLRYKRIDVSCEWEASIAY
jgi:hypothetical protein